MNETEGQAPPDNKIKVDFPLGVFLFDPSVGCKSSLESTAAWPGSLEKIAVMQRRADLGKELFHPDDPIIRPNLDIRLWANHEFLEREEEGYTPSRYRRE